MNAAFGLLGWIVLAVTVVAISRSAASMYGDILTNARDLEKRVASLEKAQVIEIAGEDVSFKATFQGVDVGLDGSPWVVFKVGEAAPKMVPVSRVYISACEGAK